MLRAPRAYIAQNPTPLLVVLSQEETHGDTGTYQQRIGLDEYAIDKTQDSSGGVGARYA